MAVEGFGMVNAGQDRFLPFSPRFVAKWFPACAGMTLV
ncbi:hypothetical protein R2A130_2427 [Ahrensia sp. R2A130]|nr:hypothetical protein R2A130_2427 [Ahrensia sp. R2A130]